jgi:hypothetical protein
MISYEPTFRPSIADIKAHPWYNGPTATLADIQQEFKQRKAKIDIDNQKKEAQKRLEKQQKSGGATFSHRKVYKDMSQVERGVDAEEAKNTGIKTAAQEIDVKMKAQDEQGTLEPYCQIIKKNTELFSIYSADTLLDALRAYCTERGLKHDVQKDKHKLRIAFPSEEIEIVCKVLSLNEDTNCLEICRTRGPCMAFYDQYAHIKDFLGDLVLSNIEASSE